jgi:hypothetical protein
LDGNCDVPLLTSGEGSDVPLIPPRGLCC